MLIICPIFTYRYLSALISQSFLDIGSLSRILDSIMKLCLQFCWSIENQESGENTSELEHITEVHQAIMFFSSRISSSFDFSPGKFPQNKDIARLISWCFEPIWMIFLSTWFRNSTRSRTRYTLYCAVAGLLGVSEPHICGVSLCVWISIFSSR